MIFKIPAALRQEHQELHRELDKALKSGGRITPAAKELARILHPHFEKEEAFVLPPLGLLLPLMQGRAAPEMKDFIPLAEKVYSDFSDLLEDHLQVRAALKHLINEALDENRPAFVLFAARLAEHIRMEEEVIYPASWMVGEYLKARAPVWSTKET